MVESKSTRSDPIMDVIDQCRRELAMNFDCPAAQILRVYGAKLGMTGDEMRQQLEELMPDTEASQ